MNSGDFEASGLSGAVQLTRGQLLDLMLDVEDRLRLLMRGVFGKERPDWEALVPKSVRIELEEQRSKADLTQQRGDLLEWASLKQLIDILSSQWKYFAPILHDKGVLRSWLEEFRKYRNALAHGQQPDPAEKIKIVLVVEEVSTRIPATVPALPSVREPRTKRGFGLRGCQILWADDHPENNRAERRHLEELGARVFPVLSNQEAVEVAGEHSIDLVISDIGRDSGESGAEIGQRLLAAGSSVPIIFHVGQVIPGSHPPLGGIGVTSDPAKLLLLALKTLTSDE
jgi:CheY-like chemotaxis protein